MVAGRPPFLGSSRIDTLVKHMNEVPAPPSEYNPDVPSAVDVVLLKALSKHKHDRYASATEFGQALAGVEVGVDPDR